MTSNMEISPSFKTRYGESVSSFNDQICFPLPLNTLWPLLGAGVLSDSNNNIFLSPGVYELTHNNKTISLKTINAVQQMTLYPELIASVLYQASGSEVCAFLLFSVLSLWLLSVCMCMRLSVLYQMNTYIFC